MKEKRAERLKSELSKLIYDILKNKIKNPLITEMFSVSSVELSNDIEHATVYISVFSASEARADATYKAICDSSSSVRRELSKIMCIRVVPEIHFQRDASSAYAERIDRIISGFTYGDNNDDN